MNNQSVVLASHNQGKLAELRSLFAAVGRELISLPDRSATAPAETASTFVENALIKARHAAALTGFPALADDSGLCVHALAGAPGVRSARYAGANASAAENNTALLHAMAGVTDRRAYFLCVLVYLREPFDPEPLIAAGRWPGEILQAPRGEHGFGYDPLFFDPSQRCSSAEMAGNLKNTLSHRARAAALLATLLHDRP